MNDFWDNLGKAVNEAACKAIKASGDAVELTKASFNIKFDEAKRDNFFKEIGKIVYANYKETPESVNAGVLDFCKCIDEIEATINEQKVKAARIKNKKFCVDCGIQLEKSVNYCYFCGTKQPIIVEEEEDCGCCCGESDEKCCDESDEKEDCCSSSESADKCCDDDSCGNENKCCDDDSCDIDN